MTRIGRLILKSPEPGANQPDLSGSPTNPHPLANSDFVNPSLIPSVPFRREPLTIPGIVQQPMDERHEEERS